MNWRQQLCHRLFGWDYAVFNFGSNAYVRRAFRDGDGGWFTIFGGTLVGTQDAHGYGTQYRQYRVLTRPGRRSPDPEPAIQILDELIAGLQRCPDPVLPFSPELRNTIVKLHVWAHAARRQLG